eukprot:295191-Chlamydomonas_euryale.AAC.1
MRAKRSPSGRRVCISHEKRPLKVMTDRSETAKPAAALIPLSDLSESAELRQGSTTPRHSASMPYYVSTPLTCMSVMHSGSRGLHNTRPSSRVFIRQAAQASASYIGSQSQSQRDPHTLRESKRAARGSHSGRGGGPESTRGLTLCTCSLTPPCCGSGVCRRPEVAPAGCSPCRTPRRAGGRLEV